MADDAATSEQFAHKRAFIDFLQADTRDLQYKGRVADLIASDKQRLLIDINDLRRFDPELAQRFLREPMQYLPPFEGALEHVADSFRDDIVKKATKQLPLKVGIEGSFGAHRVSPRQLSSKFLGNLMCVEGIVTKCSLVRPKIVQSVHYCNETKKFHRYEYRDNTSFSGSKTTVFYPSKDEEGNPLTTEFGLCTYKDHQRVTIQEMPERSPPGQLPSSVEVIVDDDLVDTCKPGDRVRMVGVYRALAPFGKTLSSSFKTVLIANNVARVGREARANKPLTKDDVANVTKISRREDVFNLLSNSIAPSIYGHDMIKSALVLALLGGAEKNLANGTHLRGDINLLMVGDPSTAKSQLLRSVMQVAPLAISTTGRGSSGVGLTAAVTQDRETGERHLEAGAMVLADRGVVCIDEFDKMSDADRVAIHEVMEQQTVTISKAGIHTSLNARCSVLAAANPVYGQYDSNKSPHVNIGLPDSLLSRFDLLFIVLDQMDPEIDRAIATHVLGLHQYVGKGGASFMDIDDDADEDGGNKTPIFQKFSKHLHGNAKVEVLDPTFLKKYVQFVKARRQMPQLSDEATAFIADAYSSLRMAEDDRTMPVTARCLETLIRLSTAHARCRLAKTVTRDDCQVALDVFNFAMFGVHTRNLKDDSDDDESMEEENDKGGDDDSVESDEDLAVSAAARAIASLGHSGKRESFPAESEDVVESTQSRKTVRRTRPEGTGEQPADSALLMKKRKTGEGEQRYKRFQKSLVTFMTRERLDPCPIERALEGINQDNAMPFAREEVEVFLRLLEEEGKVFYRDEEIHFT